MNVQGVDEESVDFTEKLFKNLIVKNLILYSQKKQFNFVKTISAPNKFINYIYLIKEGIFPNLKK